MMQPWFDEAKFGVFIHWGIYAVGRRGGESWPIAHGQCSHDEYMEQMKGFSASKYRPQEWAQLFRECGAKYAVLTTKHHDGVTLWPTKTGAPSIPNETNCGDLVGPFLDALRGEGLKAGLYFSHTDWSHVDHMSVLTGLDEEEILELQKNKTVWRELWTKGKTQKESDESFTEKWERFLKLHRAQQSEILGEYGEVDLIWFDVHLGQDRFDYRFRELREFIHGFNPKTVINSRMDGHGDYETPEQFIPVYPPKGPWELCMTTNATWSYNGEEKDYKTSFEVITMLCECLGMGGNMLLNIGPDEDGVIPDEQVAILRSVGDWIQRHEEAVYKTRRGLPHGFAYHHSSLNLEGDVVYLYVAHVSVESTSIKGIKNKIRRTSLLGSGVECSHKRIGGAPWLGVPGTLWIDLPREALEKEVSVLKVELEGKLDLTDGEGVEIDMN